MSVKLHTQFGHARSERIIQLVKNAGVNDEQFEEKIKAAGNNCKVCKRYKKPKPRPVVGLAFSTK